MRVVLSDTVGFIRELPHELVAAFRSTLEVVREAVILIHVVDSTREKSLEERMDAVNDVLADLGACDIPRVVAFNKIDTVKPSVRAYLRRVVPEGTQVSALTGEGLEELLECIRRNLSGYTTVRLLVPASRGDVISSIHCDGSVIEREVDGETLILTATIPEEKKHLYNSFMVDNTNTRR